MAKSNNKGFSLVELIIAIAVFTMLIIPIIRQLTVSLNLNRRARTTQQTAEYAEYVMEYMKSTPLDQIGKDDLFPETETYGLQLTASTEESTTDSLGNPVKYSELAYSIPSVTINRGTYHAEVKLSTKDYAAEANNPNKVNVGTLKNINTDNVALFKGQTSNNDESAAKSIFAVKTEKLKKADYESWEQLMYGGYNVFSVDTVKKITRIKVKKTSMGGKVSYTVSCTVSYKDSNSAYSADAMTYTLTPQTFEQTEPPVIYLMYNPCIYNGEYMKHDYIVLDVSEAGSEDIKMYLIETAADLGEIPPKPAGMTDAEYETYKTNYITLRKLMDDNNIPVPYNSDKRVPDVDTSGSRVSREHVITHLNLYLGSGGDKSKVHVFTNKDLDYINDYEKFLNIDSSLPENLIPGTLSDRFIKSLEDDIEYQDRLYTMTVTLYDANNNEVVSYSGTKGADR